MRRAWQALLLTMVWCSGIAVLHAETARDSLVGKWKHSSGRVRLDIEGSRLHFTCEAEGHSPAKVFSLHADYGTTRDQTVFAVISRVEVADESVRERYGLVLLDEPICFRVRIEDGVLVVHDLKNIKNEQTRMLLEGVYQPDQATAGKTTVTPRETLQPRPTLPTPVPSCGLHGIRLDNLALRDLDGKVWEYKRDRRGRLLLLDFWYHNCSPCLQAIPHLCNLQRDYGASGLEIVGIACETGPVEQQRKDVLATRGRYQINYKLLLSGGPGHCPVMEQFQVEYFPTLVLIDSEGTILWRSTRDGMDDREHYTLEKMISSRLVKQAR